MMICLDIMKRLISEDVNGKEYLMYTFGEGENVLETANNWIMKLLTRIGVKSLSDYGFSEWRKSLGVSLPTEYAEKKNFVIEVIKDYRRIRAYTMSEDFDFNSDEWTRVIHNAFFMMNPTFEVRGKTMDEICKLNKLYTEEAVVNYLFDYMRYVYFQYVIKISSRVLSYEEMKRLEANCIDII